jgi:hypothetical protein
MGWCIFMDQEIRYVYVFVNRMGTVRHSKRNSQGMGEIALHINEYHIYHTLIH